MRRSKSPQFDIVSPLPRSKAVLSTIDDRLITCHFSPAIHIQS